MRLTGLWHPRADRVPVLLGHDAHHREDVLQVVHDPPWCKARQLLFRPLARSDTEYTNCDVSAVVC